MGNTGHKRRFGNYLINKNVQFRIVFTNLVYMAIIIIITAAVILSPLYHDMFLSNDLDVQYKAAQTFLALAKRLIPAALLMFFLVFVHQMLITHRICGPLVNFSHTFKSIAEGDLTRKVYLRKGDYLREECEKINAMVDSLSSSIANIKDDHGKLIKLLEETMTRVDDIDTRKKIDEALGILKQEANLIGKDLSIFRIQET
jgi:nitrogen fixation/metabolism regulation signal transduction histidine kinase